MRYSDEPFDFMDEDDMRHDGATSGLMGWIFSRPGTALAVVAFVGTFGFIGSNAVWSQPEAQSQAFFSTRSIDRSAQPMPQDVAQIAPQPAVETVVQKETQGPNMPLDANVARVQMTLKTLRLYQGEVDGISGSRTKAAIMAYQRILGVAQTGVVDAQLLALLDAGGTTNAPDQTIASTDIAPVNPIENVNYSDIVASITPTPRPNFNPRAPVVTPTENPQIAEPIAEIVAPTSADTNRIKLLQAGLKQFGNPDMVVDGVMGSSTRKAIREFQMIFRLPETGEVDEAIFAELRNQGYIN